MKKIVVIGGGTMGLDIAQVFARNGYDVVVRDIKDEIIQASEARLNKGLDKLVSKGKLDEAKKAEILSHMSFTTELAAAADAVLHLHHRHRGGHQEGRQVHRHALL